jgi:hypothetical protein
MAKSLVVNIDPQCDTQYEALLQSLRQVSAANAADAQVARDIMQIMEENKSLPPPPTARAIGDTAALIYSLKLLRSTGFTSVDLRQEGKCLAQLSTESIDPEAIVQWSSASAEVAAAASQQLLQVGTIKAQVIDAYNLTLAVYRAFEDQKAIVPPEGFTVVKTFEARIIASRPPELMAALYKGRCAGEYAIAFRGVGNAADIIKILDRSWAEFQPRYVNPKRKIYLTKGLLDIYLSMRDEVLATLDGLCDLENLIIGGHSAGSIGSACLLLDMPSELKASVYTAAPLNGADASFVAAYSEHASLGTLHFSLGIFNDIDALANFPYVGSRAPMSLQIHFGAPFDIIANHKLINYITNVKNLPL